MRTAAAITLPPDAGIDTGIVAAARVTATVTSENETGVFTDAATPPAGCSNVSETDEITATVNPASAPGLATVDTGFGDLDGTLAPLQPAAPTVNTVADKGEPEEADLDARVAALLPNKSITDWNAVSAFMGAVVPWPGSANDPGYVNLHYSFPDRADPKVLIKKGGDYTKDITKFIGNVAGKLGSPTRFKDMWFCTSLQSETKPGKNGKQRAHRLKANALKLKSIWVDIDVGPDEIDPKTNKVKKQHYQSEGEALKAILLFQTMAGLPEPSAIVRSGGGLHVYWISRDDLTPAEWLAYADGLKQLLLANNILADSSITTDSARILRVPGTRNYKYEPPAPVELVTMPLKLYDFPAQLAFLQQFAGPVVASRAAPAPHSIWAEGMTDLQRAAFKQGPAFKIDEPDLNAGIDKHSQTLVDPRPIFQQCDFYREALRNGGADHDNPQWTLAVLGTTFMENGNAIAHEISKGHASYTPANTQAEYDRKVAYRADRNLGYPSCDKIAGAGCSSCATCPLLGKVRSPLNIRSPATATADPAPGDAPQADPSFVDPYAEFVGPAFPLGILPPTLVNFVNAEHRAMGADPSAIGMAALTAIAGAMHAETRIRAGEGWWEKPIIWTALLGLPSTMKSPTIDKSTKPLSLINHERDKRWRVEQEKWTQIPNNKTTPSPPKPARCVINDATAEKVAELLSREPSGSLLVQDELAGWLGGFERYNTSQSPRAFYLTAWNGGTFLKDRVGKGRSDPDAETRVENLALSILGGIQPDRLTKLGDLTTDGLLQRFLPVLMKPAKLGDPYYPVAGAEAEYEKLIRSISNLPAQNYHFADEAFEVRDEVLGYLHKLEMVDGFPPSLIGAIGKLNGYFSRICLVLHVARHQDIMMGNTGQSEQLHSSFTGGAGEYLRELFGGAPSDCLSAGIACSSAISRATAEAAKTLLLEFLLPHTIGLYDVVANGGQERDKLQSIANFILASDKDRLRPSDFTAGVRTLRGEPEQKIREWVGRFCSMDWLSPEEGKPGVPAKAWLVAPGLRDHFTDRRKQAQVARAEMHAILKAGGSRKSR